MSQQIESLEPEMEAFLQQLVPNYKQQVQGATEEQINRIEEIAGCPLPRFYRWFISRMGTDMGPFSYPPIDFTAATIIDCYEQGLFQQNLSFMLIGYDSRDIPDHQFYDLECWKDDDMLVVSGVDTDNLWNQFETFREKLAHDLLIEFKLWKLPQLCKGFFKDEEGDVLAQLKPIMESLGFTSPITTGDFCVLYDRVDAAMTSSSFVEIDPGLDSIFFNLASSDEKSIRSIIGQIATKTSLSIKMDSWDPLL